MKKKHHFSSNFTDEIKGDDDDGWKNVFRYGGGMLVFSVGVTALVYFTKKEIISKLNGSSVSPQQTAKENTPVVREHGQQHVTPSNSNTHYSKQRRARQSVSSMQTIENGVAEHSPYHLRQENKPVHEL